MGKPRSELGVGKSYNTTGAWECQAGIQNFINLCGKCCKYCEAVPELLMLQTQQVCHPVWLGCYPA